MYFKSNLLQTIRLLLFSGSLSLAACSKNTVAILPQDGGLAFYNASQVFRQLIDTTNKTARILLNSVDPRQQTDSAAADNGIRMPEFFSALSYGDPQQFFPRTAGGLTAATTPPWIYYIRAYPGTQQVAFLALDSSLLVQTDVPVRTGENTCLFLTDSLGIYQTFYTTDDSNPAQTQVQLKIVDLSPDAGPLLCAVDDNTLNAGKPYLYRSSSSQLGFSTADNTTLVLLKVAVFRASDPATAIGRTVISAMPGHSYSLIINGYYHDQSYLAPANVKRVNLLPDFRLSIIRNK